MEVNQMYNRQIKEAVVNAAIEFLIQQNMITNEDFATLSISMGYIFTREDGQLEALFRLSFADKVHFFALQNGKLMLVDISDEMFEDTIENMKQMHPCLLNEELPETKIQKKRREKNNKYVAKKKISTADRLMTRWDDEQVILKDKEAICKRALASFIVIQIACDIGNNNYKESLEYFGPMLKTYGVEELLNSKEKRIVDGTYSMQDAIDMDWAYEAYWALCWALGLVKDISDASDVCNCDKAISFFRNAKSTEEFIHKCKLRSKEEILDKRRKGRI